MTSGAYALREAPRTRRRPVAAKHRHRGLEARVAVTLERVPGVALGDRWGSG
jgi:hypothetical protein